MNADEIARLPYRRGVGVMLANAEGKVFAGKRIDTPGEAWQMPQGGIDPGEEPEEAALRELTEETGIAPELVRIEARTPEWLRYDLPPDLVPRLWGGRFRGQEQLWFLMRFLGDDDQIDIATEHPEFSAWRWMPVEDLAPSIVPFKRALYERVLAELGPRLAG